jgi:hypothetical protein
MSCFVEELLLAVVVPDASVVLRHFLIRNSREFRIITAGSRKVLTGVVADCCGSNKSKKTTTVCRFHTDE